MSAGEHEAVEVDVDPAEFIDEDDLGEGASSSSAGHPDAPNDGTRAPSSVSQFVEMLQSTDPAESPDEQDGTLSTSARWEQHAELAFKKITGSRGTPAWLNLVMAALLAVVQGNEGDGDAPTANDEQATDALGAGGNVEVA